MKEIIIAIVSSSVISGTIVALLNWYRAERTARKEREVKFLDEQIRNFYGRLYYHISQNERLFDLYNRYHVAYNDYFSRPFAEGENTEKAMKATLDVGNKYIYEIYNNNGKIKEILDSNSSLMDSEDIEYFLLFYEHYTRLMTETEETLKNVPPPILTKMGNISILKPEVIDGVKKKFIKKKEQLDSLRGKRKKGNVFVKKGGVIMKTWMKYLVIGWSIVSVGLILVTFQIMKKDFIEERYFIKPPALLQNKINNAKEERYSNKEIYEYLVDKYKELLIDKKMSKNTEELNDILKDEGILRIESQHRTESLIYLLLPAYTFLIWAVPIMVFSLCGLVFDKKR